MASSDELLLLYSQLLDLGRLIMERMKFSGEYEGMELLNGDLQPLLIIASHEGMTQSELAQRLRRTKGAASCIVDKLQKWELVKRVRKDTRCLLYLTDRGRRFCVQKRFRDLDAANHAMEALPVDREDLICANRVIAALITYCQEETSRRQS